MCDPHDLVIETLADSEVALRARVADLEVDVATYRELLVQALDRLHGTIRQLDRSREAVSRLVATCRRIGAAT